MPDPTIRAATEDDVQLVFDLICELATYEKLRDEVVGTPEILRASLFDRGDAEALIVEDETGEAVGYAIFYTTFSTFECRSGIWLVFRDQASECRRFRQRSQFATQRPNPTPEFQRSSRTIAFPEWHLPWFARCGHDARSEERRRG